MKSETSAKQNFDTELFAPIDWAKAEQFKQGDNVVYIGLPYRAVFDKRTKLGTRFRCYYFPNGDSLKQYRLVLFEIRACFDSIRKQSYRGFVVLASIDFDKDISADN